MTTLTTERPAPSPPRTARLDQLGAALRARGWTAGMVTLTPDERDEFVIADYGTDG